MNQLIMSAQTNRAITAFIDSDAHAILLIGPEGAGKDYTATYVIASKLNNLELYGANHDTPQTIWIGLDIAPTIDDVRRAQKFLTLKTTGSGLFRRAIVIRQADKMQTVAQNAMLKMLEEPPQDTVILLLAENQHTLLSTIISRTQPVIIQPVSLDTAIQDLHQYDTAMVRKMHTLSEGYAGMLVALLQGADEHPLVASIQLAKDILRSTVYERLLLVDALSKDKAEIRNLLVALRKILRASLIATSDETSSPQSVALIAKYKLCLACQEMINHNPNTKLLLSHLFTNV